MALRKICNGCSAMPVTDAAVCAKCGGDLVAANSNSNQKDARQLLGPAYAAMIPTSEEVKHSQDCSIKGRDPRAAHFSGKVVVTNKNVFLLKRRIKLFGPEDPLTKESFSLNQITGIDQTYEKYLATKSHHVRITRANNEDELYGLSEVAATRLIEAINAQMHSVSEVIQKERTNTPDPIEQLTKLAALLEKGFITKEEFDKKKQELL